jgi:site-specific DNA-methyltransferase (adenine-specific)
VAEPYWSDETVSLYLGDCREVLPALGVTADCIVTDQPFAETALDWDRWPEGWLEAAASVSSSMWCFGSLRMFGERWPEFAGAGWKLSHDAECEWVDHAVWEKHNGSGFAKDRLRRVHEIAAHWYRGRWGDVYHEAPRVFTGPDPKSRKGGDRKAATDRHHGTLNGYLWTDDGTRIVRSVIRARSMHGRGAINRTQKPEDLLAPLIEYACPPGGLVVDLFAGSCSTLRAARALGRRSVGIELREEQAEKAALWLSQLELTA